MSTSKPPVPISPLLALPPYATTSPSRLQALYSDISRQKHSNPASYQSNVEWWRKSLQLIVSSGIQQENGSRIVLHARRSLLDLVKIDGVGKPLSLGAVITELRANKTFIPQSEFLSARDSIYYPGWLPGRIATFVVGKPLWWTLEQLGVVGDEGILGGSSSLNNKDSGWWGDYVVVSLVENAANEVLERQERKVGGAADRLYTLDGFKKEFGSVCGPEAILSEGDTKVLLRYLERDRNAVVVYGEVCKTLTGSGSAEINAVDRGVLELKNAVDNLHAQVEGIQHKMDECTKKASDSLHKKQKGAALSYLRTRKQLEDLLSKRLGSLGTLESTLITVEAAAGDVEIMKSYESSTSTLRAILAHPSLQREHIDATMEALAEANTDAREVDDAVRMAGDVAIGVSDVDHEEELEEELKRLIEEEEKDEDVRGKLERLDKQIPTVLAVPERSPVAMT
ncbi:Snf7-domain-containing protein [Collybia nuda]|uniref:Snf7-domain-containing protein n=1 Tax=Collybia nuda TaxID=64659 RepID=A0A9P5YFW5_9AGAR|nr:Snf7-domain-containing protein [Collybia nuda]